MLLVGYVLVLSSESRIISLSSGAVVWEKDVSVDSPSAWVLKLAFSYTMLMKSWLRRSHHRITGPYSSVIPMSHFCDFWKWTQGLGIQAKVNHSILSTKKLLVEESKFRNYNPRGFHPSSGLVLKRSALNWWSHGPVSGEYGKPRFESDRIGDEITTSTSVLNACAWSSFSGSKLVGCLFLWS